MSLGKIRGDLYQRLCDLRNLYYFSKHYTFSLAFESFNSIERKDFEKFLEESQSLNSDIRKNGQLKLKKLIKSKVKPELNIQELKEEARKRGISYSRLSKSELIYELRDY